MLDCNVSTARTPRTGAGAARRPDGEAIGTASPAAPQMGADGARRRESRYD
jgi:hypothetical protein